ncbi:TadE/TadG family type IV pilus assembly protein [Desulfovibrio inopinatus]|uniref:TadE/TadG family type IV pilus assembly protein n=1 Tax=Desulfovibrio inopinatus TaxID=102109 RepID=UPI000412B900|nr:TadE/TadG family type IV pilus assembly protein [Desulfovibrio inopinatus]
MNTTQRRKAKHMAGVVSVELALVMTFLLMPLFIGVLDFGQIMHAQYVITRAAREGAVTASTNGNVDLTVRNYIAASNLNPGQAQVSGSFLSGTVMPGNPVSVTVTFDMTGYMILPWKDIVPALSTLSATAEARQR